jgi:hypothetical protein
MNTLTEVRQYLSSVPNINFGGCGIAALSMFRWCKDRNTDVQLICLEIEETEAESNLKKLSKGISTGLRAPYHCGIAIDLSIIDCEEENLQERNEITYLMDEDEMVDMINTGKGWNDSFDRDYIRDIEDQLSIDLSDIGDKLWQQ